MVVFEVIGAIVVAGVLLLWILARLTRSLWIAAWRQLQSENAAAARLHRIQEEAEVLRRRSDAELAAGRAAAEQELNASLGAGVERVPGQNATEAAGRAAESCQENPVPRS